MGLFDGLFKSKRPEALTPAELRERLFGVAGDQRALVGLCKTYRDQILANFPSWRQVPEAIRSDPAAIQRYANGLIGVATCFAEQLGNTTLLGMLQQPQGGAGDNLITSWQEALGKARDQMDELRYHAAQAGLADLIATLEQHTGTAPDHYLPIAYGFLGECHFQLGEVEQAVAPMEEALRRCWAAREAQGIVSYLGNLYEIQRYAGNGAEAAGYAERLADMLEQLGQTERAATYRRQAPIVRAGEPLNRVVVELEGQQWELDRLPERLEGHLRFLFLRNRITLRPAERLTERGEEQGARGSYAQALDLFTRAAQADALAPHPHYQRGYTLLHLRRYEEACAAFDETERLAPGWYHCRAERWLAAQLAAGTVAHESFLALRQLEDGVLTPANVAQRAEQALRVAPNLAPLHLAHGRALAALGRAQEAAAALRAGLACAQDDDTKTRLLVQLGLAHEAPAERASLLREAAALNGNLIAGAMAQTMLHQAGATGNVSTTA